MTIIATATWKIIDNDHAHESEDAAPAHAYRNSEAECDAYIAAAAKRLPGAIVLCFVPHGPFEPVPLPYAVIDRSAPTGEDRILERFATEEEADIHVRMEEEWGGLRPIRPHYGIVHEGQLEAALDAPSTRLIPGDHLKVGTPAKGERVSFPTLENYESTVIVREFETPVGPVEARMYPTGHLRVTAGEKVAKRMGQAPLVVPGEGNRKGSVAFDAILEVKANEAVLVGLKRNVCFRNGAQTTDADMLALGDGQVFSAVRTAAQAMADQYPHERLEALQRQYERTTKRAESDIVELEARLRSAKGSLRLAAQRYDETTEALEAARGEAPSPAPAQGM